MSNFSIRIMMKVLIIAVLTIFIVGGTCVFGIFAFPYWFYDKTVNQNYKTTWFYLDNYRPDFISLPPAQEVDFSGIDDPDLWRKFHFQNMLIPVPYPALNPFYSVRPEISYSPKDKKSHFSLIYTDIKDRVYNKLTLLPTMMFPDYLSEQRIFDLPIARLAISSKKSDIVWRDAFTKNISKWDIPIETMAYHLYLLNFRSSFLNKKVQRFFMYKNTKRVVLEMISDDKDYRQELILEKRGRSILSYMLFTKLEDQKAKKIRNQIVNNVEFMASTPSLTDIIIKEFKSLEFRDQITATGALFLASAWTHNPDRIEVLERAIYHLERGVKSQWQTIEAMQEPTNNFKPRNIPILEPLYLYYFNKYGRFFTTMDVKGLKLDPNLILKKKIALEQLKQDKQELLDSSENDIPPVQRTVEEQFNDLIEATKKTRRKIHQKIRMD